MKNKILLTLVLMIFLFFSSKVFAQAVGAKIGSGPSILHGFNGNGIYVMQESGYLENGLLALKGLVVKKSDDGKAITIATIEFEGENGKSLLISIDDLGKIPCGRDELQYGVNIQNELILVKERGKSVEIAVDSKGNYNILDPETNISQIDKGQYKLIKGRLRKDGRTKIDEQ